MAESKKRIGRVGQQVGEYCLVRLLGGGGFGEVYLAEHAHHHTSAAVKILQAHLTQSEDLKAFINEARTFRFKHPHIVPLLDFGIILNDVPYLVMEYAPHGTLRERHPPGTQVPLPIVVSYVNQIASALQYAHDRYLIHRDVKPENMLVGANGEILLTDFGIAAVAHNSYTLKNQQDIGGTASYMAPEQIEGKPRPASDQYALGILTYEWLCGKRPFQGTPIEVMMQHMAASPTSLTQQAPMLTTDVERVVFTALAKDPKQRFSSIQAFATAFEEVAEERTSGRNIKRLFPPVQPKRVEYQEQEIANHQFMPLRLDRMQSSPPQPNTFTVPYREDPTLNVSSAVQLRRKPHGFLVGIVALVLVLLLGGSMTFVLMTHSNNTHISAMATATAISHLTTSTVTSRLATSTATSLSAAATATAQLTSVADFTTQPPRLTNMTTMTNDSVFVTDHSVLFSNQQVIVDFPLQPHVNTVSLSLRALVSQNGPNNPGSSPISIYCNGQVVVSNYTMPGNGYSANTTSIQIPMQQLTQGSNQLQLVITSNAQTAFWLYSLTVTQSL